MNVVSAGITAHADTGRIDHRQKHLLTAGVGFGTRIAEPARTLIDALTAHLRRRSPADLARDQWRLVACQHRHRRARDRPLPLRDHLQGELGGGAEIVLVDAMIADAEHRTEIHPTHAPVVEPIFPIRIRDVGVPGDPEGAQMPAALQPRIAEKLVERRQGGHCGYFEVHPVC